MTIIVKRGPVDTLSRGDKIIIDQNEYQKLADSKNLDSVFGKKKKETQN